MSATRELGTAIMACLVGAAVVLLAAGRTWARVEVGRGAGVPVADVALSGADLAPATTGLGVLALASVAALVATRGALRRAVGLLVLAAGVGLGIDAARAGSRVAAAAAADAPDATRIDVALLPWPWVAVAGGVLVVAGGLLIVVRGAHWPSMSRRYDAPTMDRRIARTHAQPSADGVDRWPAGEPPTRPPEDLWRALDRGDDPTR